MIDLNVLTAAAPPSLQSQWVSIRDWVQGHWLEIGIAVVIGFLIYSALGFVRSMFRRLARRQEDATSLPAIIGRTIGKTGHLFMIVLSIRLVTRFAETPAGLEEIVLFAFTVVTVFQAAVWVREFIIGLIERRALGGLEEPGNESLANAMTLIRILVTVILFAIAIIVVLDNLGVDVTGLIAGLGVGGIAIGLAAQGVFEDLFAALSIIFDQPFRRGEAIGFDNVAASVEKIGLKSTRLRAFTGEEIIISNKNLLDKQITNFTRLDRRRWKYGIGVIYQTSPEDARRIPDMLQAIVEAHDAVFIRCGFVGFGDSSLDFSLEFDVMSPDFAVSFATKHAIGLEILERFNAEGLEFAYPTQTTFTAAPNGDMILPYPEQGFTIKEAG